MEVKDEIRKFNKYVTEPAPAPASLEARYGALAARLPEKPKKQRSKRIPLILSLAATACACVAIVCVLAIPTASSSDTPLLTGPGSTELPGGPDVGDGMNGSGVGDGNNSDPGGPGGPGENAGVSSDPGSESDGEIKLSLSDFNSRYDVLLPAMEYDAADVTVYKNGGESKRAFVKYTYGADELEVNILFAPDCHIDEEVFADSYDRSGSTALFDYGYYANARFKYAIAGFEHGGYRYYIRYTSPQPFGITEIMDSFS